MPHAIRYFFILLLLFFCFICLFCLYSAIAAYTANHASRFYPENVTGYLSGFLLLR